MADRDYLGRSTGEGDSPEQQESIQQNQELAEQLGGEPDRGDRDDQQPVQSDQQGQDPGEDE